MHRESIVMEKQRLHHGAAAIDIGFRRAIR